jgi:hypothetical protein
MESIPSAAENFGSITSASLEGLRTRLAAARAKRGNCPPIAEIRNDHLPTILPREGVVERADHVVRCAVCQHQLQSWKHSWEGRAALALAWSEVARHHASVTMKSILSKMPKRSAAPEPVRIEVAADIAPPSPAPGHEVWSPPPAPRVHTPSRIRGRSVPETLPPLLVFEAPPPGIVPRALLAAVGERGAAVVTVEDLEEVYRDRDFASVRAVVLTRARALGEWPEAIRRARERAPGRTVMAVVPMPPFGPASLGWLRDPGVVSAPVGEKDWEPALTRAGWIRKS